MEDKESTSNGNGIDSAYSNSCSTNSQSQRSGSSRSHVSGSNSSGTSGYGGGGGPSEPTANSDGKEIQQVANRTKEKTRKKKLKNICTELWPIASTAATTITTTTTTITVTTMNSDQSDVTLNTTTTTTTVCNSIEPIDDGNATESIQNIVDGKIENYEALWDRNAPGTAQIQPLPEQLSPMGVIENIKYLKPPTPTPAEENNVEIEQETNDKIVCLDKFQFSFNQGGFSCLTSLDGIVLYISPNISDSLGYSTDMWLDCNFTDFIHIKDRATFAKQITMAIEPLCEQQTELIKNSEIIFYVMLRRYEKIRIKDMDALAYEPFKLNLSLREITDDIHECLSSSAIPITPNGNSLLVVITAKPVQNLYEVPDESFDTRGSKFSTRHTSEGILTHVDGASVQAFGYLPQDIIGKSIMDFYHPSDMHQLANAYKLVWINRHTDGASKPYRFLIQNGCYILLETKFTSIVNGYSRKFESIIGHHTILRGPKQCDVFSPPEPTETMSDAIIDECKQYQKEILEVLAKPLLRPSHNADQKQLRQCQAFINQTFMNKFNANDVKLKIPHDSEFASSERNLVISDKISPHEAYYESNSSSESPPTYDQLNYNEKLRRFFDSNPFTLNKEGLLKIAEAQRENEAGEDCDIGDKGGTVVTAAPAAAGPSSGDAAVGRLSAESSVEIEYSNTSSTNTGTDESGSFQPRKITETDIIKHNGDMERCLVEKYKENNNDGGGSATGTGRAIVAPHNFDALITKNLSSKKVAAIDGHGHGIKRSSSHSWEGEAHKNAKLVHLNDNLPTTDINTINAIANPINSLSGPHVQQRAPYLINPNQAHPSTSAQYNASNSLYPRFIYIPNRNQTHTSQYPYPYMSAMAGLMYSHPTMLSQRFVYPKHPIVYQPLHFRTLDTVVPDQRPMMSNVAPTSTTSSKKRRASSRASSIKAESGSIRAPSATLKIEVANSPLTNHPGSNIVTETNRSIRSDSKMKDSLEGTSEETDGSNISSFYSSFATTGSSEGDKPIEELSTKFEYMRKNDECSQPTWEENVQITDDLIYRYRMPTVPVKEVLKADLEALRRFKQPAEVSEQLAQLCLDLEAKGFPHPLSFLDSEENSSNDESTKNVLNSFNNTDYSTKTMIFDENTRLPTPPYN